MGPTLVVFQSTGHGDLYAQTIGGGLVCVVWVGEEGVGGNRGGCVGICLQSNTFLHVG